MATTIVNLKQGQSTAFYNIVQSVACQAATENSIQVAITPGFGKALMIYGTQAWYYRSTSAGTNLPVAATQTLTLRFPVTFTFYFQSQSADGNLIFVAVDQATDMPIA